MSIWTHVNASFRINSLDTILDETIEQIFGKEVLWGDLINKKARKGNILPMGSEGSLQKTVWHNPDISCFASTVVTVFGDLRDYDDSEALKKWFDKVCKKIEQYYTIRQAVMQVNVEHQEGFVLQTSYEKYI